MRYLEDVLPFPWSDQRALRMELLYEAVAAGWMYGYRGPKAHPVMDKKGSGRIAFEKLEWIGEKSPREERRKRRKRLTRWEPRAVRTRPIGQRPVRSAAFQSGNWLGAAGLVLIRVILTTSPTAALVAGTRQCQAAAMALGHGRRACASLKSGRRGIESLHQPTGDGKGEIGLVSLSQGIVHRALESQPGLPQDCHGFFGRHGRGGIVGGELEHLQRKLTDGRSFFHRGSRVFGRCRGDDEK